MPDIKPVVILGIFNADTVYRAERMPKLGETVLGQSFRLEAGGKGSNQAVAAAKAAGATSAGVKMITRVGCDDFAKMARDIWAEAGVEAHATEDGESHTGAAFIFIESASGNNSIIVTPGAGGRISAEDVDAKAELIQGAGVFLTQLEAPIAAAKRGLEIARAAGVTTILNTAPARPLGDDVLALCDFITPNETEAEVLTGLPVTNEAEAAVAARALLARGVGAVIVTLGEKGVLYVDQTREIRIPVVSAGEVKETTGAGDAFNGGFATALAEGMDIEAALRFGNATAGLSVTREGAAASMGTRPEIDALLAK